MVDASYTPDEPGSEAVPEVVLNESAHESAVEIVEGNDSEESSILETQSEDEGPYVDADTSPISSEDAPAEATTVEPEGVANADQDFTESARNPDGTLPFAPEVETTGPAEENASDWDLGELETTADAVDAAKLAMQRNAAGNRPMQQLWALVQPGLKLWQRLLRGARSRLPQVAALSDRVLSGILIGILYCS
ncbi:MAG: hypothetical protein HC812_07875 [Leptolyngbya sp. RL_3_1]|nr:hypothetical protein [Leptolyngbya sp. RL_3_1]